MPAVCDDGDDGSFNCTRIASHPSSFAAAAPPQDLGKKDKKEDSKQQYLLLQALNEVVTTVAARRRAKGSSSTSGDVLSAGQLQQVLDLLATCSSTAEEECRNVVAGGGWGWRAFVCVRLLVLSRACMCACVVTVTGQCSSTRCALKGWESRGLVQGGMARSPISPVPSHLTLHSAAVLCCVLRVVPSQRQPPPTHTQSALAGWRCCTLLRCWCSCVVGWAVKLSRRGAWWWGLSSTWWWTGHTHWMTCSRYVCGCMSRGFVVRVVYSGVRCVVRSRQSHCTLTFQSLTPPCFFLSHPPTHTRTLPGDFPSSLLHVFSLSHIPPPPLLHHIQTHMHTRVQDCLLDFLKLMSDPDRHVRKAAVVALSASVHHKPGLVSGGLQELMPLLLDQTVIKPEMVRGHVL